MEPRKRSRERSDLEDNLSSQRIQHDQVEKKARRLRSLLTLSIGSCDMYAINLVKRMPLTSLNLHCWRWLPPIHLREMTTLTSLSLATCHQLRDRDLLHIKDLKSLTLLDLSYCSGLTDTTMSAVVKDLSNITWLSLHCIYRLTDNGMMHVRGLDNMTSLDLGGLNDKECW